jgi:hypothetical protein
MSIIDRSERLFSLAMKLRQVGRVQIGRILGSVPTTSGAYKALIDLLERCYFMRAELNGLTRILIDRGITSEAEWQARMDEEMAHYFEQVAKDWPELVFDDKGFTIKDPQALAERSRREGWPP